jgi:hypothetical protein
VKALYERFPEIGFFLSFTPFHPFELFENAQGEWNARKERAGTLHYLHAEEGIAREVAAWFKKLQLDEVETLYIYGLGLGYYYEPLKEWLKAKRERALIFIEDDISVIDLFIKQPLHLDLLEDPQVHLRFIHDREQWKPLLESSLHSFFSDHVHLTALASYASLYKKRVSAMALHLQRSNAALGASLGEVLYGHHIFRNLHSNFKRINASFFVNSWKGKFQNIPAVICGAGPSLGDSIDTLKTLEERALIIAGGSTLTALSARGIIPHLGIALDPNPLEYVRLKEATSFEIPFIYASRLYADVFALLNGPFGYLNCDTGGLSEQWLHRSLEIKEPSIGPELGREAFSVTTIAVALARALGCNPILFVGVDLAFTGKQAYASGVVVDNRALFEKMKKETKSMERLLKRKDRKGRFVYTLVKWVMESETIGNYARGDTGRDYINCTEEGIGFPYIAYQPFEEVVQKRCLQTYDLRSWLHTEIESSRLQHLSTEKVLDLLQELKKSLERSLQIVENILKAGVERKNPLLEMDLSEELAFDCLLQGIDPALDRLTRRSSATAPLEKWNHYKIMIENYLKVF